VSRTVDNAVDEGALLVAVREGEIVLEIAAGGEFAGGCGGWRILPGPLLRSDDLDLTGVWMVAAPSEPKRRRPASNMP